MKRILPLLLAVALLVGLCPMAMAAPPNGVLSVAVYNYDLGDYDAPRELSVVALRLDG